MTIFLNDLDRYKVPNLVSPVCLGLTARVFYSILKTLLPAPIKIGNMSSSRKDYCSIRIDKLVEHLNHGRPTYRLCHFAVDGPWLLRRKIYGDKHGPKEEQRRLRYENYRLMTLMEGNSVKTRMLPNPYNMGEEWYYAVHIILQNGPQPQWSAAETDFWHSRQLSEVFRKMKKSVGKFVDKHPRNHNLAAS